MPASTSLPCSPTSAWIRSRSSPAARLVNVTARIDRGRTPFAPIRYAIRWAITRVLPEPAPARISSGPSVVVTARACSGLRRWTISSARAARRSASAAAAASSEIGGPVCGSAAVGASRIHSGSSGAVVAVVPSVPTEVPAPGAGSSPNSSHVPWPSGASRRVRRRFAGSPEGVGLTGPF